MTRTETVEAAIIKALKGTFALMTASQIAEATSCSLASVASQLHKMHGRGILARIPNHGPRGGYGYQLTEQTRRTLDDAVKRISRYELIGTDWL